MTEMKENKHPEKAEQIREADKPGLGLGDAVENYDTKQIVKSFTDISEWAQKMLTEHVLKGISFEEGSKQFMGTFLNSINKKVPASLMVKAIDCYRASREVIQIKQFTDTGLAIYEGDKLVFIPHHRITDGDKVLIDQKQKISDKKLTVMWADTIFQCMDMPAEAISAVLARYEKS